MKQDASAQPERGKLFERAWRWRELRLPYLLLAPSVLVLLALSIYPLIYAVKVSLQTGTGAGLRWSVQNFARLAGDRFFFEALKHTLVYAAVALTCEFLLGLALAVLLNNCLRGRTFFRAVLLVPMMLPPVVVGVVWRLMLNPHFGAINGTLNGAGLDTSALLWTASPRLALLSVIMVDVWQWTPFIMLIALAGLSAVPKYLYEAADVDRASGWFKFRHITLPLVTPLLLIAILFRVIDSYKMFDQAYGLTGGGPAGATQVLSI
ncbi:MAG TPA: sugar ABC transporter permease, partial [Pyrinomonadaceae bacterium]